VAGDKRGGISQRARIIDLKFENVKGIHVREAQKRILCVEDHPDTCELIAILFNNCDVVSAHSKAAAFQLVVHENFDLIILDYHLPDGTGVEICHFIRGFDKVTPILFFTGTSSMTEPQVATAGAQGVIKKRGDFSERLRAAVYQFL
jgi:CheY-like chemotaxis protein